MDHSRYAAQTMLPEIGVSGQEKLARSRVLVVGVGGLGCASAAYLAMAGVGKLRLVDGDVVELANLGRQILYTSADIDQPKVEVAAERLRAINPEVTVEPVSAFADRANFAQLLAYVDLVVDGTDSLGARLLLNRALVTLGIPVVFGAATRFSGSVIACVPKGPCYRCIWSEAPEAGCESAGVVGPLVGVIGAAQATEAIRVLLGLGEPGNLILADSMTPSWKTVKVRRRPDCSACGIQEAHFMDV